MSRAIKIYTFDLEIYPNFFLFGGKFLGDSKPYQFEMSTRKNQRSELLSHLSYLQNLGVELVGFNNVGFDYPIVHQLLNNIHTFTFETAYQECQKIINSQRFGSGASFSTIGVRDRILPQIDLFLLNHFNNANKGTTLKALQCAMRSESVEDLPIAPGTVLTEQQMDEIIPYNGHDITETEKFFYKCEHLINMRRELLETGVLTGDVLNFNDVKIGYEFFIKKIGRSKCFVGNKPRQTLRESIAFKDIILPKISFRDDTLTAVLEWFKTITVYPGKKEKGKKVEGPKHECTYNNLQFHFGLGGAHASVESKYFESNATHVIRDVDVTGMYPSIAVANGFRPEHLGDDFSSAYAQLLKDRSNYKKGTSMNATLKLANNGAFGKGDDQFSCFYDPKFPKEITINGQLQILQLVEYFSHLPGVSIIQANTDGVTLHLPRSLDQFFELWRSTWEQETKLSLEVVDYSKMWIRDVNNYLAITTTGKIKRKGAYQYPVEDSDYDGTWNKDFSMMVVPKVTEQMLITGQDPAALLQVMTDKFDFMCRYKTPAGADVFIGDEKMSKTVRYYVSTSGQPMKKIARPKGEIGQYKRKNSLSDAEFNKVMKEVGPDVWDSRIHTANKSKYDMNETSIESGRLVKCCNKASDFCWDDVDYDYYLQEIKKLEIL